MSGCVSFSLQFYHHHHHRRRRRRRRRHKTPTASSPCRPPRGQWAGPGTPPSQPQKKISSSLILHHMCTGFARNLKFCKVGSPPWGSPPPLRHTRPGSPQQGNPSVSFLKRRGSAQFRATFHGPLALEELEENSITSADQASLVAFRRVTRHSRRDVIRQRNLWEWSRAPEYLSTPTPHSGTNLD